MRATPTPAGAVAYDETSAYNVAYTVAYNETSVKSREECPPASILADYNNKTQAQCQTICRATPSCAAYTYARRDARRRQHGRCVPCDTFAGLSAEPAENWIATYLLGGSISAEVGSDAETLVN